MTHELSKNWYYNKVGNFTVAVELKETLTDMTFYCK